LGEGSRMETQTLRVALVHGSTFRFMVMPNTRSLDIGCGIGLNTRQAYAAVVTSQSGCPITLSTPGGPRPVANPEASVPTRTSPSRRL